MTEPEEAAQPPAKPPPENWYVAGLIGQTALTPLQVASSAEALDAARQTVPVGISLSAGHSVLWPSHISSTSQAPAAGRQLRCSCAAVVEQLPSTPPLSAARHDWQSVLLPPPQAVLQHTPSAQKPLVQSLAFAQAWPVGVVVILGTSKAPRSHIVVPRGRPR